MIPAPQLFAELATRHGHYCPMSTLGLRVGWAARRKLEGELQEMTYLTETCAVDGIRLALGDELLQVKEQGRHILYFADSKNCWQIELQPKTLRLAASYRLLTAKDDSEQLLDELRHADEASLFRIGKLGALR